MNGPYFIRANNKTILVNIKVKNALCVFLYAIYFVFLILSILKDNGIISYFDEGLCLFNILAIVYFILSNKKINKSVLVSMALLFIMVLSGLIGSMLYGKVSIKNVALDIFFFVKPFSFLGFFYFYFTKNNNQLVLSIYIILSKILIILISFYAIFYLFNVNFDIAHNDFTIGSLFKTNLALLIIFLVNTINLKPNKYNWFYFIVGTLMVLMANTDLGLIGCFLMLFFNLIIKKNGWRLYYVLIFFGALLLFMMSDFNGYILNESAPRFLFYKYSFITLFNYPIFGSGFGTYGTYVAAHHYSDLYYFYDFNSIYGLTPNSVFTGPCFLYDSFYPMIIAQFGLIGTFIFGYLLINFGISLFKKSNLINDYQALCTFCLILLMATAFNIAGSVGCLLFMMLGVQSNEFKVSVCERNSYQKSLK